ncbi:MAG: TadE/TadG family type IV pilus assembly protein [Mariniblastus sp.]
MKLLKTKTKRSGRRARKGAAVVEFAVCLPVIFLIAFGSIEAASMLFLRQALIQSSYEGAKVAVRNTGTNALATQAAQAVASGRNLNGMTVTFDPADVSAAAGGDIIRVTVVAPGDSNSFIPFGPFQNRVVSAQAVMVKE